MEAIGAIASTLQIASQCAQCTMTIVQWYRSVKSVDERIESFKHEIYTLQRTYETLRTTFADQSKLTIANTTNKDAGGRLARQLESTLREGERTIVAINNELRRIHSTSNTVFRPIIKQVRESLSQGDLARHRDRIVLVNHELHLVLQMMAVSMSLQQDASASNQIELEKEILSLRQSVDQLTKQLAAPRRTFSFGETVVGESTADDKEKLEDKATQEYIESANKFIETASAAVTARSVASTTHPDQDQYSLPALRRGSAWAPLSEYKLSAIGSYVENLPPDGPETPLASDAQSSVGEVPATTPSFSDDDVEVAVVNSLLSAGQSEIDAANYALAEENFREAHSKLSSTEFGSHIIATMSDVTLSLAYCCIKQEKYDGAVELLQPLYEGYGGPDQPSRLADQGEALSACHMLGEVYLKKSDFLNAEQYSSRAFKERKSLLGLQHAKTQESVQLVIQMYEASGRSALAKAYRNFQRTPQDLHVPSSPITNTISRSSTDQSGSAAEASTHRPRRSTFHLSSRFRRSGEKEEAGTKAGPSSPVQTIPIKSTVTGDTLNDLSISPRDIPAPHLMVQPTPAVRHTRQDSTQSQASLTVPRGWSNSVDASNDAAFATPPGSLGRTFTGASDSSQVAAEANITAIRDLSKKGSKSDAVKASISFMRKYDQGKAILVQREDELKRNIEKSKSKGLAGTGYGYAPIHFFCSLRPEAVSEVEMLIKHGVDINAVAYKAGLPGVGTFTPLSRAVELGHGNIVQLLLNRGAYLMPAEIRASRDGRHPLLVACKRGYVGIVMSLLRHGVVFTEDDFRNKSWHGNSLLHEASWRCDLAMVKYLMDYHGHTPTKGSTAYSFIGHPGQQDAFGMTPIMYAVDMRDALDERFRSHKEQNRINCLRLLLEPNDGSEDKAQSEYGAADQVVAQRSASMDNRTRRMGIDLHIEDLQGHSVFWYAAEERDGDANLRTFLDDYSRQSVLIDFE